MPSSSGVRSTSAPRARMMMTFSCEKFFRHEKFDLISAIDADQRQADSGIAGRGSTIVPPGASFPSRSALRMMQLQHDLSRCRLDSDIQVWRKCRLHRREPAVSAAAWSAADQIGNVVGDAEIEDCEKFFAARYRVRGEFGSRHCLATGSRRIGLLSSSSF